MIRVSDGGAAIEVEVWAVPAEHFGSFVAGIPANASHAEAGRAVIDFLITPEAKRVLKAKGLEPT